MVFDAHSDLLYDVTRRRLLGEHQVLEHHHLDRLRRGGVEGLVLAVWASGPRETFWKDTAWRDPEAYLGRTHQMFACARAELRECGRIRPVRTVAEAEAARSAGQLYAFLAVEGMAAVGADPRGVDWYYGQGVRLGMLTWNETNALAAGAGGDPRAGLTEAGRRAVRRMGELGMMVDVSHLNDGGFWDVMDLCQEHRGNMKNMEYLSTERVDLHYELPLGEIVFDFFDQLKSRTKGYATLNYELSGEQEADLVKVDILIQGERVDAFSAIVHRDKAYAYGVMMTKKLQKLIPRQLFEIPLQAAIGARIIARETISALRKDVLAKCYGGDITRKRKLLEKQKAGKKKMKMLGRVEVPQEAFIAALSTDDTTDRDTREKIRAAKKKASL